MDNQLIVIVKKYLDKVNGNTYHSVQFEIDNNIFHSGKTYGYGTQYKQTVKQMLTRGLNVGYDINYIVVDNCKASQLKEVSKVERG